MINNIIKLPSSKPDHSLKQTSNYLKPIVSKVVERAMYNQLMTFKKNYVLYKHQYGIRPNHSTIHPIIHLLNHCGETE